MPTEPYFFFRPLVAADRSWASIYWQSATPFATDGAALARCYSTAELAPLASLLPMLAPLNPEAMENLAFFDAFDAKKVIFVLPGDSLENPQTLTRCKHLRGLGHRFGLLTDHGKMLRQVPVAAFDYLCFDASQARQALSTSDLAYAGDAGFGKVAINVGSHEMFGWLTDKMFDWSDSHFLTSHNPLNAKEPDLTRMKMLKLLNLVRQDGDTREIENIFREEPKLSYNLLRLVNSVAVGARTRISNFSQAIAILGRRQLQRWLQMLIYADHLSDGSAPNPLMQIAAARGRQMELLCAALPKQPDIPDPCDNAFMIGLFSLLEVLINLPMKDILREIPMDPAVGDALLGRAHDGVLGQLLSSITAGEASDFAAAEELLRSLGISAATHTKSQLTALYWAARINVSNHD